MSVAAPTPKPSSRRARFWWRLGIAGLAVLVGLAIWAGHGYLVRRFAAEQNADAQLRATLYAGNLQAMIQRHSLVPLLLSRDPVLLSALRTGQSEEAEKRLVEFGDEIGAGSIFLLDSEGRLVASSEPDAVSSGQADQEYFQQAMEDPVTVFSVSYPEHGPPQFNYARRVEADGAPLGVVVVNVDLGIPEENWRRAGLKLAVVDAEGRVLLSSVETWRGTALDNLLAPGPTSSTPWGWLAEQVRGPTADPPFVYIFGTAHLRTEVPVHFRNWKLNYFATLEGVRAQANAVMAMGVTVLAILAALGFWRLSRRTRAESRRFQRESDELRLLNRRLQAEIAARQRVERNLKDAEQSLEQASKLAALGQMSAAVSHELNQPLAAMKTYLAGARLLLKRNRAEEALSSFQRIDDLIGRMGGITRQLKSYARKGEVELEPVDLRESVRAALAMMAPQLGKMAVEITTTLPSEPAVVQADPLRIEQIIVNLLRNALDAVSARDDRRVKIFLAVGDTVLLSVEDNGEGIKDPDRLFEPFHTTKKPGEGLGLGLAISAGFAAEMGGKLVARNAADGGAVFDLVLPRDGEQTRAAE
jgi:two-component system, NtrC family, C4-dicarboxylate transport sensor histidine kinase DctB